MNLLNFPILLLDAGSGQATTEGAATDPMGGMVYTIFMIALMVGVFYFLLIRPQKKRQKQEKNMRDSLQIADEVVTVGGIIGRVLSIKEDTVLIETGGDRTRIRIMRASIAENRTVHDS